LGEVWRVAETPVLDTPPPRCATFSARRR
jgi:hypothetical protein